jgi:hypothetical protein
MQTRSLLPAGQAVVPAIPRAQPKRAVRWIQRLFFRDQPALAVAVPLAIIVALVIVDLVPSGVRGELDEFTKDHELGVSLGEHLIVAILVAATAYYLLFGLKLQRALKKYRQLSKTPDELVEWSEGRPAVVRLRRAELLADGIARSFKPAVAVVQGRTGTGRTSFIVALVKELAEKKLIPVPIRARRDGSLDIEKDAKKEFTKRIDRSVSSDAQADAIWRRARSSRSVVVLVDGLDDEVVDKLSDDGGLRLRRELESLSEQQIRVVLATTKRLPLAEMVTVREDLDLFTRDEAEEYVTNCIGRASEGAAKSEEAIAAIRRLRDPVDETLVAPFYLELVASLQASLGDLPPNRDLWRAKLLGIYLDAMQQGMVIPPRRQHADADRQELAAHGRAALRAATGVAGTLKLADSELSVDSAGLDRADVKQATEFGLLWQGAERVGFTADDLGAYMVGRFLVEPKPLLEAVEQIATRESERGRRDRFGVMALIFWALNHSADVRTNVFEQLLGRIDEHGWTRPAIIAAAVRIATTCEISRHAETLHRCAERCIDEVERIGESDRRAWYRIELIKLVRALAEWRDPRAHAVLWRLATNRNIDLEWPAAKALAMASDRPAETLHEEVSRKLERAHRSVERLSRHDDVLGNEIASLAWILPVWRADAEEQFVRVKALCLDARMSPLRGEMSLAQGLKHAIVNNRCADENLTDITDLLFRREPDRDPFVRFWHARIVLLQALLAHVRLHDRTSSIDVDELDQRIRSLQRLERHPLVLRAIKLVREGLKASARPPDEGSLTRYMWVHERDAVRWVEQGRDEVAQLAADTVLLSNMSYQLRRTDAGNADRTATLSELPPCIRKCSHRKNIANGGCTCKFRLCETPKTPALDRRAPFAESFCREQIRVAAQKGPPLWATRGTFRSRHLLEDFWSQQAAIAGGNGREPESRRADWWPHLR